MRLEEILGDDTHAREIIEKIEKLKAELNAKGILNSSGYIMKLCELLLIDSEQYCAKLCDDQLIIIKGNNLYKLDNLDSHIEGIKEKIDSQKSKFNSVLKLEISRIFPSNTNMINGLRFPQIFDDKIQPIVNKFRNDYKIYSLEKIKEESTFELAANANKIAIEANKIAKSKTWTSWFGILISTFIGLGTLYMTYLTYKK